MTHPPCICAQHGESYRLPSGLPACCVTRYRAKRDPNGKRPGSEIILAENSVAQDKQQVKRGRKRKVESSEDEE